MGKKFKNKICVYCATSLSDTADHVFAREFFLVDERANLPKVPACKKCNKEKSDLEHYLTALLPFGGRHDRAREHMDIMIPKRLQRNKRLHEDLYDNRSYAISEEHGTRSRCLALPIDGQRFLDLFKFITKGLMWHHWQTLLDDQFFVETISLTEYGEKFFAENFLRLNSRKRVEIRLGDNSFNYVGLQAVDQPQISVWQFIAYNGIKVSDSGADFAETSTKVGSLTGPKAMIDRLPIYKEKTT